MTSPPLVNLTIEGRRVAVPPGTSILEAAKYAGVLVPHYCYHPSLPVAGLCRMCLVEVEKMPKLAPSCATAVAEGQVVHVHSEKAREARKGVLEFLLINHPLDCPICDQSGECELQDYTFAEGRKDSRYREPKRFNPVEDFGGDVVYVPNRCILCTRCVRFMDAVAHDPVLNVSERGDRALIGKFEGEDLTHPWAGNVIDLCPVGALLSKDSLYLLSRLVRRTGGRGAFRVPRGPEAPLPGVEDLALRAERASNVRGAKLFGFVESETPLSALGSGDVLVVADEELNGADATAAARAAAVVVIGTTL